MLHIYIYFVIPIGRKIAEMDQCYCYTHIGAKTKDNLGYPFTRPRLKPGPQWPILAVSTHAFHCIFVDIMVSKDYLYDKNLMESCC